MCSGKTTLGRHIAKIKKMSYYDTDKMVVDYAKKSIANIFNDDGEKYFRVLESDMLKTLKDVKNSVISCGGGVVLDESNVRLLREISTIVYLHASVDKIYQNLGKSNNRPLLQGEDAKAKISDLLAVRKPIYMKSCHIAIDVTDFSIEKSIAMILKLI